MSTWVPYCDSCQVRYATAKYSTGSYCTQCAALQPNKGAWQEDYPYVKNDHLRDPYPGEVVYRCQCCKLGFTMQRQVGTLFYTCGDRYDFCYKCALKHKVCPRHPDYKLKPEGLTQLQKLIRNN